MSAVEPRGSDSGTSNAQSEALLDFQLEKTHGALAKAGEAIASSSVYALMFLALTSALILGDVKTDTLVTVPLVGLELSRWHAAGVSLILSAVFFYNLIVMKSMERLLSFKLAHLMNRRFGVATYHWYLFHPSVFTSSEEIGYLSRLASVVGLVPALMLTVLTVLIPLFAFLIGDALLWSIPGCIIAALAVVPVLLALAAAVSTPLASQDREAALKKIET